MWVLRVRGRDEITLLEMVCGSLVEDTVARGLTVDGFRVRTLNGLTLTRLVEGAVGLEGIRDVPRDEKAMKGFMVGLFAPCEST